jgi:hypothetical protein
MKTRIFKYVNNFCAWVYWHFFCVFRELLLAGGFCPVSFKSVWLFANSKNERTIIARKRRLWLNAWDTTADYTDAKRSACALLLKG